MAEMPKYYKIHTDGHTVELEPIYTEMTPVVHARWEFDFHLNRTNFYHCSECGRPAVVLSKEDIYEYSPYCHCGAKMDLKE